MGLILTKEFVKRCRKTSFLQYALLQAMDELEAKDKKISKVLKTIREFKNKC